GIGRQYEKKYFYHYYYFPDENEQDIKVKIFLPNSQSVNYTDTQYPRIANTKELDDIELKIDQFSNVLYNYNILYLEELNYNPGLNILATSFLLASSALYFLMIPNVKGDPGKAVFGVLGIFGGAAGIGFGFKTIFDAFEAESRRAELKKLESTLKDIINTK
ncbi:MAG: hypothetical protein JSV25_13830, partial [Spirochaetota bacterium]